MNGFLNINKPAGVTSFGVLRTLSRSYHKLKMGHLGTLDPMATGVLPVAVGNATRLIEYIDNRTKVYSSRMVLGGVSDTQDATGNITWIQGARVESERIIAVMQSFTGTISQIPPMYSAIHHGGKRLYELARQGKTVEVSPRQVQIDNIEITDISLNDAGLTQVSFRVQCSEGTYIRTLCHDIGQKLETGAYMDKLIRLRSGIFSIDEAYSPETVIREGMESCLKPIDYPLAGLPVFQLDQTGLARIVNGNSIDVTEDCPEGMTRLYYNNKLVAVARCQREETPQLQPVKVLVKNNHLDY